MESTLPPWQLRSSLFTYALEVRPTTADSLAPEAFILMRQAFPYLVNWTNRNPIARWYLANGGDASAINPRGYFADSSFDVSDQTKFTNTLLSKTRDVIQRLNAMNPRPQGVIIWDLEGEEFLQPFTYVGNPPTLYKIAPEMDAAANQMFSMLAAAGYRVGMTIRPSNFGVGPTLPITCKTSPNSSIPAAATTAVQRLSVFFARLARLYQPLNDVFIDTSARYPVRGYTCAATNTWTQPGANLPNYQTIYDDDSQTLSILEAKISYATNRWGATLFYIDSVGYSQHGALTFTIFRELQQKFPNVLLIPEAPPLGYFGATAPYEQANRGFTGYSQSGEGCLPAGFLCNSSNGQH